MKKLPAALIAPSLIILSLIIPSLIVLSLAGCVARPPAASPYPPVPLAAVEVMPKPPVSATPLVWQPGHYEWNGAGYVWSAGLYVQQEGHGPLWQPGYWTTDRGDWAWQPAHWR